MTLEEHLAMLKARGTDPSLEGIEAALPPEGTDVIARTIWGEGRGEGPAGMQAVANVLMNRLGKPGFAPTPEGVAKQRKQFSVWNPEDKNLAKMLAVTEADPQFAVATRLAREALTRQLPDITGGATHYTAPEARENWSGGMQETANIGRHSFYRDPRKTAGTQLAVLAEGG